MSGQKRKHSILEKHSITLDDKQKTAVTFYLYYNNQTPIYYGLEPIIKLFKFTKESEVRNSIPRYWVKLVVDFDDPIFVTGSKKFSSDASFVEASGIAFLIALSENKALTSTVTNLYNICIRKTENDRVRRINTKIVSLKEEVRELKAHLDDASQKVHSEMNIMRGENRENVESLTVTQSIIKEAIGLVVNNHTTIQSILSDLLGKL